MGIRKIDRATYHARASALAVLDQFIGTEVAWYANDANTILGVIALDKGGKSWNFVISKKSAKKFQPCKIQWGLYDRDLAKVQLLLAMEENDVARLR